MDSVKDDMGMKRVSTEMMADRESERKIHGVLPHLACDKDRRRNL